MSWVKISALFLCWLLSAPLPALAEPAQESMLITSAQTGAVHSFDVTLAITEQEQAQGLMGRSHIEDDEGMLFVFATSRRAFMWMKNTYIPLDMLFIDSAGKIQEIVENTTPLSTDIITSQARVKAVLEIHAGTIKRLGIATGDHVTHKLFDSP